MSGETIFGLCAIVAVLAVFAGCVGLFLAAVRMRIGLRRLAAHPIRDRFATLSRAAQEAAAAGARLGREAERLVRIGLRARALVAVVATLLRA